MTCLLCASIHKPLHLTSHLLCTQRVAKDPKPLQQTSIRRHDKHLTKLIQVFAHHHKPRVLSPLRSLSKERSGLSTLSLQRWSLGTKIILLFLLCRGSTVMSWKLTICKSAALLGSRASSSRSLMTFDLVYFTSLSHLIGRARVEGWS